MSYSSSSVYSMPLLNSPTITTMTMTDTPGGFQNPPTTMVIMPLTPTSPTASVNNHHRKPSNVSVKINGEVTLEEDVELHRSSSPALSSSSLLQGNSAVEHGHSVLPLPSSSAAASLMAGAATGTTGFTFRNNGLHESNGNNNNTYHGIGMTMTNGQHTLTTSKSSSSSPLSMSMSSVTLWVRSISEYLSDPANLKFLLVVTLCLPFPATLTYFQFVLAVPFSLLFSEVFGVTSLVPPSRHVIKIALPFCLFRILGHISASVSLWLVPVSYAHTVKALGPLFSVFLSRMILGTSFSTLTYLSLLPLISGVILATATEINFNLVGTAAALFSVFVLSLQSIYSKKLFVSQALDEANLLFHTSLLSAIALTPYWFLFEAAEIDWSGMTVSTSLFVVFNGLTQYGQCICAFLVVSLTSPVTYSIASLFKRVFVIVLALLWFGNPVTLLNLFGIMTTFLGLFLYHKSHISDHKSSHGKERGYSPNGITSASNDMLTKTTFGSGMDRLPTHIHQGKVSFQ